MHLLKETNLLQGTTTQICHESLKKRFCLQMLNLWSNSFSSYHMICAMLYYWMLTWISWFHAELLPQGLPRIMFGTRYLDGITIYKLYEDELIIFTTVHFFCDQRLTTHTMALVLLHGRDAWYRTNVDCRVRAIFLYISAHKNIMSL